MTFMRCRWYRIYFSIITIFLLSLTGVALYVLLINYDSLIASVVATVNKKDLGEKIRSEIFTRSRFMFLQQLAWLVFILVPVCFWLAFRYRACIVRHTSFSIKAVWRSLSTTVRMFKTYSLQQKKSFFALMAVIVAFFIHRLLVLPLTYDEMWSYNYYTGPPFYYSFFTYSNYPLFEMTTHFFKGLPFPMRVNLRLSPFITGMATCFLLYTCLRKYFNSHFTAMIGVTAFAFMPLTVVYMVSARGIMHELFFAVTGIFSLLFWLEKPERKRYLVIYSAAAVLGVYAMPTHFLLLAFLLGAGLNSLLKKSRRSVILFIKINVLVLAGCVVVYFPILVTTGSAVFENVFRSTPSYSGILLGLPYIMRLIIMDYAGYTYTGMLLFTAAVGTVFFLQKKLPGNRQFVIGIAAGLPVSTVFFYLITGFPYPGRSLAFGALSIPLIACLYSEMAKPWFDEHVTWKKRAGVVLVTLSVLMNSYFYLPVNGIDNNVASLSRIFINKNITSCYDNSSKQSNFFYYYPGIEYYYRIKHKTINFTVAARNSMRYKPLVKTDKYNCIVYDVKEPDSSRSADFHQMYRDPAGKFIIFIRNDLR